MPHRADHVDNTTIQKQLLSLLAERKPESSICPSDVARALFPDDEPAWRALMPKIRSIAVALAREDRIEITRGGRRLHLDSIKGGPIRLHRGAAFQN
ncbi:DUF3253 domain-containing protein [Rhodanobacter sp. L36]|uniref:DUF3253 domain-containing protein n=1 Tax=Rhodanobacter sp. L36 TaxID=1747221 RepID=UPI00131ABC09|nr:DUF3253 domain-containing protein [Rhodanobacter sp. L36]